MKKTVLYIDPSDDWSRIMRAAFGQQVTYLWVQSFEQAREVVQSGRAIDAIVIGWSTGDETLEFIRSVRTWYTGVLVAATPEMAMNAFLVAYGCTYGVREKEQTATDVLRLLGRT